MTTDAGTHPDPTLLTTLQVQREIGALKELIETRLDAMDKALDVAHANYTNFPTDIDRAIIPLREWIKARYEAIDARFDAASSLTEERFRAVGQQFVERDTRTTQSEVASKEAIAAALQAAKEAVGESARNFALLVDKLEASITKQIDAQKLTGDTAIAGLNQQLGDLKDRLTRIESLGIGAVTQKAETRAEGGAMWGFIGGMIGLAGFAISVAVILAR